MLKMANIWYPGSKSCVFEDFGLEVNSNELVLLSGRSPESGL